jgi:uncharacterized membrane protein YkoI
VIRLDAFSESTTQEEFMSMKPIACMLATAALLSTATHAVAMEPMPKTNVSMETCLAAALDRHPGKVKELEFGLEDGEPHYEFEILTADGRETEVECSALTGKIVEVEWENENMDLDAFLEKARITPAQAREIALRSVPGRIVKMDLETTSTGVMSYEFEVRARSGEEVDVEIDAMSGKVIEIEVDIYEIGDVID